MHKIPKSGQELFRRLFNEWIRFPPSWTTYPSWCTRRMVVASGESFQCSKCCCQWRKDLSSWENRYGRFLSGLQANGYLEYRIMYELLKRPMSTFSCVAGDAVEVQWAKLCFLRWVSVPDHREGNPPRTRYNSASCVIIMLMHCQSLSMDKVIDPSCDSASQNQVSVKLSVEEKALFLKDSWIWGFEGLSIIWFEGSGKRKNGILNVKRSSYA